MDIIRFFLLEGNAYWYRGVHGLIESIRMATKKTVVEADGVEYVGYVQYSGIRCWRGIQYATLSGDPFSGPKPLENNKKKFKKIYCLRRGPIAPQAAGYVQNVPPYLLSALTALLYQLYSRVVYKTQPCYGNPNCQVLHVTSPPQSATSTALHPVMVWLHGGAFVWGHGYEPSMNPESLVKKGVVVVQVNSRLGAYGFLEIPGCPGNRGLLDIVEALKWVQQNIASFGGDPNSVTLFGESAGAMTITTLMASQTVRNMKLFHRAILQSGAGNIILSSSQANKVSQEFFKKLNVSATSVTSASLASFSINKIVDCQQQVYDFFYATFRELGTRPEITKETTPLLAFGPVRGSTLLENLKAEDSSLSAIHNAITNPAYGPIPTVLCGYTENEYSLFTFFDPNQKTKTDADSIIKLGALVGAKSQSVISKNLMETPEGQSFLKKNPTPSLWNAIHSDFVFRVPIVKLAAAIATAKSTTAKVFVYRLDKHFNFPKIRAAHMLDMYYVFGTYPLFKLSCGTGKGVADVSETIQRAWVDFAKEGNPGWSAYDPKDRRTMLFGFDNGHQNRLESAPDNGTLTSWED
eukprot:PhF_6_TR19075/c0_g1_i1/m.28047/K03929/pnbA; para-nitrobenzyl esterase